MTLSGFDTSKVWDMASMFAGCSSLTSIDLSGFDTSNVELMASMFAGCSSLTSIDLSSFDVSRAWERYEMFYDCSNLKRIYCKDSETCWESWVDWYNGHAEDDSMFTGCTNLEGVDGDIRVAYDSSKVNNQMAKSASLGGYFTPKGTESDLSTLFAPVDSKPVKNGVFKFSSELKEGVSSKYTFDYDDSWIFSESDSNLYKLLKTSIRVALSAFGTIEDDGYGPGNIKNMMDTMGFKYLETSVVYPKPTKDALDSIGSAIGLKNIKLEDGSTRSIILVAVRGGGYGAEWGGNFHVGTEKEIDSTGFRAAAGAVDFRLNKFINDNKRYISDNLRVWIVGYSRAAATSNLVASDLISGRYNIDGVSPSEVRAFCFECPMTTSVKDAQNSKYNKIINIVNPIDFVPKLPLSYWKFNRYGQTLFLPSFETSWTYYGKKKEMESNYAKFFQYNGMSVDDKVFREEGYIQTSLLGSDYYGQGSSLDMFLHKVSCILNRDKFATKYEAAVAEIAASALGGAGGTLPDINISIPEIIDVILAEKKAFSNLELTLQIIDLFAGDIAQYGHYGELCMSWIDTFSSFKDMEKAGGSRYRKAIVDCPVDVTVRDSSGNIVGEIKNDKVQVIENGIVTRIDEDEQKLFFLPIDEEYTIEIKATDDGEVNYSIHEYDFDSCITEKVINYKHIEIKNGDELLGTATDIPEEEDAVYTLKYAEDEDLLEPDEVLLGDEVDEYLVEVTDSENGTVTGGGSYVKGEFAQVTATADEGWSFEGWYSDGKRVSAESEYRFAVENDITLEAIFSKQSVEFKGKTTRGDMFNLANNVKVTWKAVPGAKYYKVYREGITDKKESREEPVIVTERLIGWDKEAGLTNGHAYRYKIVASLTGKGDPSGDSPLSYSKVMYRLKTVVIRSVKNTAPGKVTVKYDKTTSGDSYVLQYCEREDMVGAKTKVVLGANNTSYTIGGLKKGKTYYISIRVRKKVNGIDYYTTFGVPKKIKVVK